MLQWGRNLIVAEGSTGRGCWGCRFDASMGPQLDSCGRNQNQNRPLPGLASMGPQLDSCGRPRGPRRPRAHGPALQWGRNLIVAEGRYSFTSSGNRSALQWGRNLIVAEGPSGFWPTSGGSRLQWGRNLIVAEGGRTWIRCRRRRASMGPQLDSCGRRQALDWTVVRSPLQWGRNLIVAEGSKKRARTTSARRGFNGAAT